MYYNQIVQRVQRSLVGLLTLVALLSFGSSVAADQNSVGAVICVRPGGGGGCQASIQAGVNLAQAGDTVQVAAGTYAETVALKAGVKVAGAGKGLSIITSPSSRIVRAEVATIGPDTVLEGFSIQGSNLVTAPFKGAGIYIANASPTIRNNLITNNQTQNGAGIYVGGSSAAPVIELNEISSNRAVGSGGNTGSGGAILVESASRPIIRNNNIHHNTAAHQGGAIIVSGSIPQITGNTFEQNSARSGGALLVTGTGTEEWTVQGNTFRANTATDGAGAVFIYVSRVSLIDNDFISNQATSTRGDGGALIIDNANSATVLIDAAVEIKDNLFLNNRAAQNAGGAFIVRGAHPSVSGNTFRSNHAVVGGGGLYYFEKGRGVAYNNHFENNTAADAGAIFIETYSQPQVISNTIINNYATNSTGALMIFCRLGNAEYPCLPEEQAVVRDNIITGNRAGVKYAGIFVHSDATPTIENNVIASNVVTASNGLGGGLAIWNTPGTVVRGNQIRDNQAGSGVGLYIISASPSIEANLIIANRGNTLGGGIFLSGASGTIVNNVIAGNSARASRGGAGIAIHRSEPRITNNTIVDNTGSEGVYGWADGNDTTKTTILRNNIIVGHTYGLFAESNAAFNSNYNLVWGNTTNYQNTPAGGADVSQDPLFTNRAGRDYTLRAGSPAIDRGDSTSSPNVDRNGTTRPLNGDGLGAALPDIGAYEAPTVVAPPSTDTYIALGQTSSSATAPRYNDIVLYNVGSTNATTTLVFTKNDGSVVRDVARTLIPNQRVTVRVNTIAGMSDTSYSTKIESSTPNVVAELSAHWKGYINNAANPAGKGGYGLRATATLPTVQYFAQGFFNANWDNNLVLYNPSTTQSANISIRLVTATSGVGATLTRTLAPGRREVISLDQAAASLGGVDFSTTVSSTGTGVLAEMEYYYTKRNATGLGTGGFASRGATSGATTQYFALGYNQNHPTDQTRELWVNFIAFYNYNDQPATVTITFKRPGTSAPVQYNRTLAANSRDRVKVSDIAGMQDVDYSTTVVSSVPVVAEIGYYYDQYNANLTGSDGFVLRGTSGGATTQVIASGYTGPTGANTWDWVNYLAINNPTNQAVTVTVYHYAEDGSLIRSYPLPVSASGSLAANSRYSYRVDNITSMDNRRFSTKVVATGPVIAEMGIYYNNFAPGTSLAGIAGGYALPGDPR